MLNTEDRRAIDGLFQRLKEVERTAEPRDAEAEELIRQKIAAQPSAPYYLAQTVVVQEHALEVAERRIRELEAEVENGRGDILGGLFGGGRRQMQRQDRYDEPRNQQRSPWDRDERQAYDDRRGGGGGFLAGAAQTALGVAGGVLLGSAIGSMFGAGSAHAAEAPQPDQNADNNSDNGNDAGNDDFGGDSGDFGGGGFDGGGFDMGGDF